MPQQRARRVKRSSTTMKTAPLTWGHVSNLPTHHTPRVMPTPLRSPLAQASLLFSFLFIFFSFGSYLSFVFKFPLVLFYFLYFNIYICLYIYTPFFLGRPCICSWLFCPRCTIIRPGSDDMRSSTMDLQWKYLIQFEREEKTKLCWQKLLLQWSLRVYKNISLKEMTLT